MTSSLFNQAARASRAALGNATFTDQVEYFFENRKKDLSKYWKSFTSGCQGLNEMAGKELTELGKDPDYLNKMGSQILKDIKQVLKAVSEFLSEHLKAMPASAKKACNALRNTLSSIIEFLGEKLGLRPKSKP